MINFGPAGMSAAASAEKLTLENYLDANKQMGLMCYEYPLTYGTNISDASAKKIGELFCSKQTMASVHAPYYINFASSEPEKIEASINYLLNSVKKAKVMGADRVVFHPGSLTKQTREVALNNCIKNLKLFLTRLEAEDLDGIYVCPETMGKHGQVGTWREVLTMCKLSERFIPTLDFGHINAYTQGGLKTKDDFFEIINEFVSCGKTAIHIHFSKIEYGEKGELRHLTFSDPKAESFGPDHEVFLDALKEFADKVDIRVISESAGTQDIDSKIMLDYLKKGFSKQ